EEAKPTSRAGELASVPGEIPDPMTGCAWAIPSGVRARARARNGKRDFGLRDIAGSWLMRSACGFPRCAHKHPRYGRARFDTAKSSVESAMESAGGHAIERT